MNISYRKIRVFVASPSDVIAEREALSSIINEMNLTISALAPEKGAILELLRWETHVYPLMGRPQAVINEQIGEYDIFIGIMWKRFGSNTGVAGSGTEEEYRRAFSQWKINNSPRIMFYFNKAPFRPPTTVEEVEQLSRVVAFRNELAGEGLIWEYESAQSFADVVRPHLISAVGQLIASAKANIVFSSTETSTIHNGQDLEQTLEDKGISYPPAPVESTHELTETEIPKGRRLRILEISENDAYRDRQGLIGQLATSQGIYQEPDGWWRGPVVVDKPLFEGDDRRWHFFAFKCEIVK